MSVSFKLTWRRVSGCAGAACLAWLGTAIAAADITPANAIPSPAVSNKMALVPAAAILAAADANPYSVISNRNVFHLNPPPPPVVEAPPAPDLPKVMLTGFLGKGKSVKVLLAIPPKENKDPTVYLTLAPGEKGGESGRDVELVQIHLDKEEVDIINSGTPQTLSVKSNSYVPAPRASPPAGGAPAMPRMPGIRRPPGFPRNAQPPAGAPAAAATSSEGSAIVVGGGDGNGSAIVAGGGGGGGNSSLAYDASGGGAFVSGGASFGAMASVNNAGAQMANQIFNRVTGQGFGPGGQVKPAPSGNPMPGVGQAALLQAMETAGGPPAPPMDIPGE